MNSLLTNLLFGAQESKETADEYTMYSKPQLRKVFTGILEVCIKAQERERVMNGITQHYWEIEGAIKNYKLIVKAFE